MNGLVLVFIIFVLANIASFVNFMYDDGFKELMKDGAFGWREEIAFMLCGSIGAFLALILCWNKPIDKAYKIVIPTIFFIEIGTVLYLLLFEVGVVK